MEGELDMGHARALLALDAARQIEAAHRDRRERPVGARGGGPGADRACAARRPKRTRTRRDRDLERLEDELSDAVSAPRSRSVPRKRAAASCSFTTRASITSRSCLQKAALMRYTAYALLGAHAVTSTNATPCLVRRPAQADPHRSHVAGRSHGRDGPDCGTRWRHVERAIGGGRRRRQHSSPAWRPRSWLR